MVRRAQVVYPRSWFVIHILVYSLTAFFESCALPMDGVFHFTFKLPNYDNVRLLTYLDMCIQETLRLYPQLPR